MICPYCQHDLDVDALSCPRCETGMRRGGDTLGLTVRKFCVIGGLLLVSSIMLVNCVMNQMPGGANSPFGHDGSPQASRTPLPDTRSPELKKLMATWALGQQASDAPVPPVVMKGR